MPWARWLWLAVLAVCLVGCGVRHVSASSRDQPWTFQLGGLTRSYSVHVPPGPPVGLVLNLHGGGGTGVGQEGLTDFDAVADANGLLVVYPDGYDKSWADGRGTSPADRRHVDDVGFLVALAAKLQNDFGIAPRHVFATGISNGGFMSNKLACDRADVFAAIAPVAGTLGAGVACNPSRPVSVLEAHGTADPLVPFKGGDVHGRGGLSHSISVANMVDKWRSADGCQGDPLAQELPNVGDRTVVHRFDSTACADSSEVVFYQIDNGGHTWPGGKQYLPTAIIGPTTRVRRVRSHCRVFSDARPGLVFAPQIRSQVHGAVGFVRGLLRAGSRCARCSLRRRTTALLAGADGQVPARLAPLLTDLRGTQPEIGAELAGS